MSSKGNEEHPPFDEDDARFQVRILGLRVDALTKENASMENDLIEERTERRKLDERVVRMEKSFQRGAGMLIILPVIGTIIGIMFAWGKVIFAPWFSEHPR